MELDYGGVCLVGGLDELMHVGGWMSELLCVYLLVVGWLRYSLYCCLYLLCVQLLFVLFDFVLFEVD